VSSDLQERLQLALGDAYRLERELARGGMSRLFLATEASLNRQVVVKVLPPDFTRQVSTDRFKQEIELAAHLQRWRGRMGKMRFLMIRREGAASSPLVLVLNWTEEVRSRVRREP
jgi:serine/threonine protein kinase